MSITLIAAIYRRGPDNATQRAVLQALAFSVRDEDLMTDPTCYPSFRTVSERTALGNATVKRAVKELAADGWLSVEPRTRDNGALTSNLYTLNVARLLDDPSYPSITVTLAPSVTMTPPSITVTPPLYHSDTSLVSQRYHPSITAILHDPVSYPVLDPADEPERETRARASSPPVVVSRPVDRTPGGSQASETFRPPPDRPIPDSEPAMVREAPAAVRLIWRLTSYWPPQALHDWLAEALGDAPDEPILRRVCLEWAKRGYKATNYDGIVEWYQAAMSNPRWQPPTHDGKKSKSAPPVAPNMPATGGVF